MSSPASRQPITELAAHLVALARSGQARMVGGIVAAQVDATHVLVDLGDQAITAAWPASLGAAADGMSVRVLVSGGTAEVITTKAAPADPAVYAMASGSTNLTFSASTTASVLVSWPAGRFTVAPRWVAWLRTAASGVVIATSNETMTEGRINGTAFASTSTTVSVGWLAWQRTATSRD